MNTTAKIIRLLILPTILSVFLLQKPSYGQIQPIDVFESTLKIGGMGSEEFFYAFKAGDQLIINLEEVKGKELKEFEVVEYPSSSKFMDYKTKKIKDKVVQIQNTGIYKFRLVNSSLSGRICRIKLQRVPSDDLSRKFNSTVSWRTRNDTTYFTENERYLISRDTVVESVVPHQVERVHSETATNGKPNKSVVFFTLPVGTVAWSYYLGVGSDAEAAFRKAEENAKRTRAQLEAGARIAQGAAKLDPSGSLAMASLALRGVALFGVSNLADNIQYWITDQSNAGLFMAGQRFNIYQQGNGPLCYGQMKAPLAGIPYLCLLNDNFRDGIDVHIRVSAVTVKEQWGLRTVKKYSIKSQQEPYLAGN